MGFAKNKIGATVHPIYRVDHVMKKSSHHIQTNDLVLCLICSFKDFPAIATVPQIAAQAEFRGASSQRALYFCALF